MVSGSYAGRVDPAEPDRNRWAADVVLSDGSTMHVRPIRPDDGDALVDFHERQSRESIYFRFFSPRPHLSEKDVHHLTNVDGIDRMAFVAERDAEVLGVARYDRYGARPVAEVAFFTDDRYNGRGIATLLLEYLAAHAREVGITRFEAQVLPSNRRMVRVFQQAGFEASSAFADGVIEVSFDIEPSESAMEAMAQRALRSERQAVVRLLEPRAVAVVGAGRDPSGIGHRVLRNLLSAPFAGSVHPVHPEAEAIAGVRAVNSVRDLPDEVDLAVICVPAAEVAAVVEACGRERIAAVVVISAGFAEAGPEGETAQADVLAAARRFGVRVLGPNCLGVINTDPAVRLHATFAEIAPLPGRVGLLSQSGTLGAVILERARRGGLGISSFVAVGNKADLSGNDLLLYWLDDPRTDVVLLYLESFGNPRRFGRNVRRVGATKPVFAVRSGGALDVDAAGWLDDDTVDALLRQTGVVRVPTIAALLDAALVASHQPVPAGPRVAVVGNSGGSASMAADACLDAGLELADLGPETAAALDDLRLHGRAKANPVDLRYDAGADHYAQVLDRVLVDAAVDVALVVHAPYDADDRGHIEAVLDRAAAQHPDTTIVACIYGPHPPVTPGGVPVFDFPDEAAHAMGRYVRYATWRAGEELGSVLELDESSAAAVCDIVGRSIDRSRRTTVLDPETARSVLTASGIDPVPVSVLRSPSDLDAARADGPVAIKADRHRPGASTRQLGVALDLDDADDRVDAVAAIAEALGDDAWPMLVQPMVAAGTDVRVAVETHPIVGPVVRVGPGGGAGRFAEAPRHVLPITDLAVAGLVADSGVAEMLDPRATGHLVELIRRLAAVVDAAPEIVDLVCDPVIVRSDGADVVEVRVAVAPARPDDAPPVRRLEAAD